MSTALPLAEGRWGAASAQEIRHYAYVTVGPDVGIVVDGDLINGLAHPEFGHYRPPRMRGDRRYKGCCPFHSDCIEGLICGPAIEERTGQGDSDWPTIIPLGRKSHIIWRIFVFCSDSPPPTHHHRRRIMNRSVLFPLIREKTRKMLGGYLAHPNYSENLAEVIIPSGLVIPQNAGAMVNAGVLGGFILAEQRTEQKHQEKA
jgi:fructokinase